MAVDCPPAIVTLDCGKLATVSIRMMLPVLKFGRLTTVTDDCGRLATESIRIMLPVDRFGKLTTVTDDCGKLATVSIRIMLPVERLGRLVTVTLDWPPVNSARIFDAVEIMAVELPEIVTARLVLTTATLIPPEVTPSIAVESNVGMANLTIWACIVDPPMLTSSVHTPVFAGGLWPVALKTTPSATDQPQHKPK